MIPAEASSKEGKDYEDWEEEDWEDEEEWQDEEGWGDEENFGDEEDWDRRRLRKNQKKIK